MDSNHSASELEYGLSSMGLETKDQPRATLEGLPAEVRVQIWHYLLHHDYNRKEIRTFHVEADEQVARKFKEIPRALIQMMRKTPVESRKQSPVKSREPSRAEKRAAARQQKKGKKEEEGTTQTQRSGRSAGLDSGIDEAIDSMAKEIERIGCQINEQGELVDIPSTLGPLAWEHPERLKHQAIFARDWNIREGFPTAIFRVNRLLGQEALRSFHEINVFVAAEYLAAEALPGAENDLEFELPIPTLTLPEATAHAPLHHVIQIRFRDVVSTSSPGVVASYRPPGVPRLTRQRAMFCARYLEDFVATHLFEHSLRFRSPEGKPLQLPFDLEASGPSGMYATMPSMFARAEDLMRRAARVANCTFAPPVIPGADARFMTMSFRLWHRHFLALPFFAAMLHQLRLAVDRCMRDGYLMEAEFLYNKLYTVIPCVDGRPPCPCHPNEQPIDVSNRVLRSKGRQLVDTDLVDLCINLAVIRLFTQHEIQPDRDVFGQCANFIVRLASEEWIPCGLMPALLTRAAHLLIKVSVSIEQGRSLVGVVPYRWKETPRRDGQDEMAENWENAMACNAEDFKTASYWLDAAASARETCQRWGLRWEEPAWAQQDRMLMTLKLEDGGRFYDDERAARNELRSLGLSDQEIKRLHEMQQEFLGRL